MAMTIKGAIGGGVATLAALMALGYGVLAGPEHVDATKARGVAGGSFGVRG